MSPSPLSGLLAVDRSNAAKNFRKQRQSRSHACRIYCAAYGTSQGDLFDSFSAIADLLIICGEDFFDLSGVLQSGHGDFVRHRLWFEALSAWDLAGTTRSSQVDRVRE